VDSATAATPTKKLQYPVMVFFYVEVKAYINILWIPRRVSNDMRKKHSLSWGDEFHYVLSRLGLTSMAIIVHRAGPSFPSHRLRNRFRICGYFIIRLLSLLISSTEGLTVIS